MQFKTRHNTLSICVRVISCRQLMLQLQIIRCCSCRAKVDSGMNSNWFNLNVSNIVVYDLLCVSLNSLTFDFPGEKDVWLWTRPSDSITTRLINILSRQTKSFLHGFSIQSNRLIDICWFQRVWFLFLIKFCSIETRAWVIFRLNILPVFVFINTLKFKQNIKCKSIVKCMVSILCFQFCLRGQRKAKKKKFRTSEKLNRLRYRSKTLLQLSHVHSQLQIVQP